MINNNLFLNLNLEDDEIENSESSTTEKKYMEPTILENIDLNKYFKNEDILLSTENKKKLKITDKGLYIVFQNIAMQNGLQILYFLF